jgi:hypothetical protein
MSPRTAKYVEAMIRQGDSFDYDSWLKRVREDEAQAKQLSAGIRLGAVDPAPIEDRTAPSDNQFLAFKVKAVPAPRATARSSLNLRDNPQKARLRRWLEKVQAAWRHFQANRARDAVYDYLEAVFAIVMHYRARRRTKKLLRHAFAFADLRLDQSVDPFTAVIRCRCGDAADKKMISKWARALRYAARRKPAEMRLKAFMKEAGGVNECAPLAMRAGGAAIGSSVAKPAHEYFLRSRSEGRDGLFSRDVHKQ